VNGVLKYYNGSWADSQGSLTTDINAEFRVHLDQLFMVGANSSNTFLTTAVITDTTYATDGNVTNAPNGKFVEIYNDQVFIANAEVGGVRYPSNFYRSSVPTIAGVITWDTTIDYEQVYTNNGEEITSLHNNQGLNKLLIFKRSSIHSWDTYRINDIWNVGTTAHRSVQTIEGVTFFYNSDRKKIYAYNGETVKSISRPIDNWIKGIQNPSDVFGGGHEEFYKLYVGDIVVEGITYTNCEIRYSEPDNTFVIYSYYDNFTSYATHSVSDVSRLYAGADDGEVHQLAIDGDEVYSDDDHDIGAQFLFETDFGVPTERKFSDKILIYSTQAQNLTGRIRGRGKDWSSQFSVDKDEQEKNINPKDSRFVQFHFSESSMNAPFKFEGISLTPKLTTKKYS